MDEWQQRISEIAQQLPGYPGYQSKERRREADKLVRMSLAAKFEEERGRLTRLQRQAPLDSADDIERLDRKIVLLIERLRTAPRGYAGWFDAGQIDEGALDQLTKFDEALTDGIAQVKSSLDAISSALKSKSDLDGAINACADTLDALNARFDQREQFLAMGIPASPSPAPKPFASPLDALKAKPAPPADLVALANLNVNDAVTFANTDFLVTAKMTFTIAIGSFWAFLLEDRGKKRWLRVGPAGEVALCNEISLSIQSPPPDSIKYENQSFTRGDAGTASARVEGAGGVKRGSVNYARYSADAGSRLWVEDFGTETRAMWGQTVEPSELKLYRR